MSQLRLAGSACLLLLSSVLGSSCASISDPEAVWPEDSTGQYQLAVSTGWAAAQADVELKNGTGPLSNPALGGNPNGASTTDLEPVFGLGVRLMYYVENNWAIGTIIEHRIFDPKTTRPLNADVDIDAFGTDHFIFDVRYVADPIGQSKRWRPYVAFQLGYVPGIKADGTVDYGNAFAGIGQPNVMENISLDGDRFFTAGALVGASYLLREGLSLDFALFYEKALEPSSGKLRLNPVPGAPVVGSESTYDGSLKEEGLYGTIGLSWYF
ncbi:MAG: outer membrane beta-barrel protein [Planctomycetes bacterium]|nr:outer membrane beta-barrel protein [Planctomycetota bacterium]MCB9910305.1 outer membrane beta-barrel protein [Planctomycetota bacterium]HPF13091.1 hypothetical protein [Planctomycetota bacterium]HRV80129.1 hypothetical protein [Planctomycetota bacterium]